MPLLGMFAMPLSALGQAEADHLFADTTVYEYRLYFDQPDFWDSLVFNYEVLDEEYMPCDMVFEGSTYVDIGIRFKGNSSYFLYPGTKKSFKLDFNRYLDSQTFFGLKKINFNNGFMDPTQIREKLFLDVLERHVPCIRGAYARLFINDVYWGLYTVVEQPDETFIQDRFGDGEEGNLFKGDPDGNLVWYGAAPESYYPRYELKTNELENDWSDLIHLIDVLNHTPAESLQTALIKVFDVRNFVAFQALNNMFVNLDSYYGSGHNYYIYHQESTDRFVHLAWDVNEAFGAFDFSLPPLAVLNHSLFWSGTVPEERPLNSRILDNDYFAELYLNFAAYQMDHEFDQAFLFDRIDFYRELISSATEADPHRMFTYEEFQQNINQEITWGVRRIPGLKDFIAGRRSSISSQLSTHESTDRLFINEFMASNETTVTDDQGEFEDWIELYNDNLYPVDLGGYCLTDDLAEPDKWPLPDTVIGAGGFLLVWADDDTGDGPLHAGFKLGASGEQIALVNASLGFVDSLTFSAQETDVAFGRYPDGADSWMFLTLPTPGESNRLPENRAPVFLKTSHLPYPATSIDSVRVVTKVSDESLLTQVSLFYDAGAGYVELPMYDDGLHSDSSAADSVYGATIPPFSDSTLVSFYLAAYDDSGAVTFDPPAYLTVPYRYQVGEQPPALFINEFMADNDNIFQDPQGDYDDWLEIYNAGSTSVDVGGLLLTDDFSQPDQFTLPDTVLAAGGFLIVWADGDTADGPLHAPFKLGASGEQLGLFSAALTSIDSLTFGEQATDISYGRTADGGPVWTEFTSPTPGSSNGGGSCCTGQTVGDCDCSGLVDIADIQVLVDHMFLTLAPLCCEAECNINYPGSGHASADTLVDITDLQVLIEHFYITLLPLPTCP